MITPGTLVQTNVRLSRRDYVYWSEISQEWFTPPGTSSVMERVPFIVVSMKRQIGSKHGKFQSSTFYWCVHPEFVGWACGHDKDFEVIE